MPYNFIRILVTRGNAPFGPGIAQSLEEGLGRTRFSELAQSILFVFQPIIFVRFDGVCMNRGLSVLSILDGGQKKRGLWGRELEAKTVITSSYISHGDLRNRSMKNCIYFRVNVNSILAKSRPKMFVKSKTKENPKLSSRCGL